MTNLKKIKINSLFIIVAIILLAAAIYYFNSRIPNIINDNGQVNDSATTTENNSPAAETKIPTPGAAASGVTSPAPKEPKSLNLPIPFTSQAPTANWDELHNEACEEASAIMANAYLAGDRAAIIPAARVETEISDLTVWQDKNFGYHLDSTAKETAQMIEGFYGLQTKVFDDYTLQDIKDQLNLQHVVILPVNGRVIGNRNYKQPGPIYHMLIIRGYTATGLITNDSGTRLGRNYPYTFNTLHNAGADWDHNTDTIDQSKKIMIVVSK